MYDLPGIGGGIPPGGTGGGIMGGRPDDGGGPGFPAGEVQDCKCMTYLALVEAFHLEVLVEVSWVEDQMFLVGEVHDCT